MSAGCAMPPPGPGASAGVVARAVSASESVAANRGWWDDEAPDYQAEHGAFLGDVDFVWCPERLREADAELLGPPATLVGARVLEVGCGAASCARWLVDRGADAVGLDLSAGMLRAGPRRRRALRGGRPAGPGRRLAPALPRRRLRPRLLRVRRGALRRRHRRAHGRGRAGPAPRRAVGVRGQPPDALDLPRRPGRGRPLRHPVLLRPDPLRRGRRRRPHRLRRAPPHARRPDRRRRRGRPGPRGRRRAGVARGPPRGLGPVVPAARRPVPRHGDLPLPRPDRR